MITKEDISTFVFGKISVLTTEEAQERCNKRGDITVHHFHNVDNVFFFSDDHCFGVHTKLSEVSTPITFRDYASVEELLKEKNHMLVKQLTTINEVVDYLNTQF